MNVTYEYLRQERGGYVEAAATVAGPFYHGGRGRIRPGGLVVPGRRRNSWGDGPPISTHVWFSADLDDADLTAQACAREHGRGYLYEVEPTASLVELAIDGLKSTAPLRVVRLIRRYPR